MDNELIQQRITRAKEVLETIRHAALATVNDDQTPHNTPLFVAFDAALVMYWSSSPKSRHSHNITRTGQAYVVLYDAMGAGGGLHMAGTASVVPDGALPPALAVFNAKRGLLGRSQILPTDVEGDSPQRLYQFIPSRLWINYAIRDKAGLVVEDVRREIQIRDLVK